MCYRPLHISNVVNGHHGYDVPCGKCAACRQSRVDDITFRVWYEFSTITREYEKSEYYKINNSRGIFATLTYNDRYLPTTTVCPLFEPVFDDSGELLNVPPKPRVISCFDKTQTRAFLKSLNEKCIYHIGTDILGLTRLRAGRITDEWRKFLDDYYVHDGSKRPLKYFLVCERGHNGTKRPHYHCAFLIEDPRLTTSFVKNLIRDSWIYGFSYNLSVGGERSDFDCIKYVCKYICKDDNEFLLTSGLLFHDDDTKLSAQPFTLCSNNIGACYLDNVSRDNLEHFVKHGVVLSGKKEKHIPLPRYYVRKLAYDYKKLDFEDTASGMKRKFPRLIYSGDPKRKYIDTPSVTPWNWNVYNKNAELFSIDLNNGVVDFVDSEYVTFESYLNQLRYGYSLNEFGKDIDKYNSQKRADTFTALLQEVQSVSSFFEFLHLLPDHISLHDVSAKSFHYFVEHCLYRTFDQAVDLHEFDDKPVQYKCYMVYLALREYSCRLREMDNINHDIAYSCNLTDVMSNKPQLFQNICL